MRLIIRSRLGSTAGGLRRYNGSGIFSSIGRKLFSSGLKKVINVAREANLPQKIANAVVNGAQTTGEALAKAAGEKLAKVAAKNLGKVQLGVKRSSSPSSLLLKEVEIPPKHSKVDIERIINGSGIIIK